jgi:glycosyltransferase involved in cell wall biosynthesis
MTESSEQLVTVVIPAYNAAAFIRQAIDSVLTQTWPLREILVIDDGSTDATGQVLEDYGDSVRVVHKPNGGLSSARNRGIREAEGDLIAFLDADDRWLPDKLARQVKLMADHPDIGFCSTKTLVETPDGEPSGEWACPIVQDTLLKTLFLQNGAIPGSGSGVMARRKLFDLVGLFDESLRSLEDIDMWMRLAAATNYRCIDDPLTVIVKHPDSMSRNLEVMRGAAIHVMKKNRPLLPSEARGSFWRSGYAGMLTDYAKWEYRTGGYMTSIVHLLEALVIAPIQRGRLIISLLVAAVTRKQF